MGNDKVLLIKPPDSYLENEFVFPQLGINYLESYLEQQGIETDVMILSVAKDAKNKDEERLDNLQMLLINDSKVHDEKFDKRVFEDYKTIGLSVMSPQAPYAYLISELINSKHPNATSIIGGSHPRYYLNSVANLPEKIAFDFVVPQDGWEPLLKVAKGEIRKENKNKVLVEQTKHLKDFPAPTRPGIITDLYKFEIAGIPASHTITALGCPFTCNFCESATENLRKFSDEMISEDLETIAKSHKFQGSEKYAVMFFDDVGLMNPRQVNILSEKVSAQNYSTWRAFTHAYLVMKFKEDLLGPFYDTGGRRIGLGLETGSQRSLNYINKRNGQFQSVQEHYDSVVIANDLGIAVDAFTMIYPWENEDDLKDTTELVKFIAKNPVKGFDELGRPLKNHVDSTIMTPYQGTKFNEMISLGQMEGVEMVQNLDPGLLFYKGISGSSGWPYKKTVLPRERYEEEQALRNSFRPKYR